MFLNNLCLGLEKNHFEVLKYLQVLDKQHILRLGGALGLNYDTLHNDENRVNTDHMVAAWLRKADNVLRVKGEPTWRILIEALREIRQEGVAIQIEKEQM